MRNFTNVVLSFLWVLGLNVVIAAAQCTVVVAPYGNDSNPGSIDAPLATPAAALQNAGPGAVVCLRAGTYTPSGDLVAQKPVTIQSYPGEWAILTADYSDSSPVGNIILVAATNVTIQDLELSGGSYYGVHVSDYVLGFPPANTLIQRVKIHNSGYIGVKVDQADNVQVLNSEIYSTGTRLSSGGGVDIIASLPGVDNPNGPGATVSGNYIHDLPSAAIVMKGGTVGGIIEKNLVQQIAGGGIYAGGDTGAQYFRNAATSECFNCIVRNNVVAGTDYVGIACWAAQGAQIVNNTVVNAARSLQAAFFALTDGLGNNCNNTTVENNVFETSGASRMVHVVSPGPGIVIDRNDYFNAQGNYAMWWESWVSGYWNSLAAWQAGTGQDQHSMALDPLLDASNSYRPLPGSPLIDSGVTLAAVPTDYAGVSRPQGAAYDIGAFEVVTLSAPVPSLLSAISGGGQSATTGTAFGNPLVAQVTDTSGNGVAGVVVTFSAPSSGAGAAFNGSPALAALTDVTGTARTSSVVANATAGSYTVTASAGSLSPAFFPLLNNAPPPPPPLTPPPPPPTASPIAIALTGGTAPVGTYYFSIFGTVTANGNPLSFGIVQFFVNGVASDYTEVFQGQLGWSLAIPAGTPSGTQLSIYAVYSASPQYPGSQSPTVIVSVQ